MCSFASNFAGAAEFAEVPPTRGLQEVPSQQVKLRGGFWGPRLKIQNDVTISHSLDCLEKDGHVTNFDKAASQAKGEPSGHMAFDSDLYKALEGAMYCLQNRDDDQLRKRAEGILDRILAAQQPDGFLIAYFILRNGDKRWEDMRLMHQLYNAGHFFEMAVEHYRLTGQTRVLDAARRFADHIDGIFGPGKRYDVPGHEEVELALVKLYRATGERRYLELARFFLDERGYAHGTQRKPFDPNTAVMAPIPEGLTGKDKVQALRRARNRVRDGRMQDHKPLIEQEGAIGHAVRAGYVYSAMADIARFMDAPQYERALERIWQDVVARKMYVTGGIGTAQYHDEGFGDPYLLPNRTAYCESCAAIAHVLWQHRMNLLRCQAKYADVMELALYNGVLSGISLSGDKFFYENPLASKGGRRSSWIGLSCCPTNLARIIPQVGGLAYACGKRRAYVNLYAAGEASLKLDDGPALKLAQQTDYPWAGLVRLTVTPQEPAEFELCLRIPGWALGRPVPSDLYRFADAAAKASPIVLKINGKPAEAAPTEDGYVHIRRQWQAGDAVELDLPMPIRRVLANENVKEDVGKVALMRGPVVYCLEAVDQPGQDVFRLVLPPQTRLRAEHRPDLLGGVTVIQGQVPSCGQGLVTMTAVPYYAWANRGRAAMTVWINEVPAAGAAPAGK